MAVLALVCLYIFGRDARISAASTIMWNECDNVCSDSTQCNTTCYDNPIQFEDGNPTTCLLDGYPYDTSQVTAAAMASATGRITSRRGCPDDCAVNICVSTGCSPESPCGDSEACDAEGCCFNQCVGSSCGGTSRSCGFTGDSCESDVDCCSNEACQGDYVFIGFVWDSNTNAWDIPVWNLQYYCAAAALAPSSEAHH